MITLWGLLQYKCVPFGLRNFPWILDEVLRDLPNKFVYIDDIMIYLDIYEEHIQALRNLFAWLQTCSLVINKKKSQFFKQSVEYLGFEITPRRYRPTEVITPKIEKLGVPKDKRQLQKFLGLVDYYRTHVPKLGDTAAPLYQLLEGSRRFK